jgi:hypothetical protein
VSKSGPRYTHLETALLAGFGNDLECPVARIRLHVNSNGEVRRCERLHWRNGHVRGTFARTDTANERNNAEAKI